MSRIETDYGKNRKQLKQIIPLDTPFALYVSPSHLCNFKCFYCLQGKTSNEKEQLGIKQVLMSKDIAEHVAEQAGAFKQMFKRVMFSGCGEPLVNKEFPQIVNLFVKRNIAEKYELNTNGLLLTPEFSERIVDAGITNIRISIQGLSSEKYWEIAGVRIDYNKMLENLRYLYLHKRNCTIYVKIIDACFDEQKRETEDDFYRLFDGVCDTMYVEHLIQAQPHMDDIYKQKKVDSNRTLHNKEFEKKKICPLMFYQLQVDAVGNVFPCCVVGMPESFALGNVREKSLIEIWNSKKINELYLANLRQDLEKYEICNACEAFSSISQKEDCLDKDSEKLVDAILKRMNMRNGDEAL